MNGQGGNWSDYGQQPMANQSNLNFVSTSFDPGRAQAPNTSYNSYNSSSMNPTTTSFDDEPPLLEGKARGSPSLPASLQAAATATDNSNNTKRS